MNLMIFVDITKGILPFAIAAATGLMVKGARYAMHAAGNLKTQAAQNGLDWAMREAKELVQSTVIATNQTIVSVLKESGQWSSTDASCVFQSVLASVMSSLSIGARSILGKELPDLPSYLGTIIEAAVATAPNRITAKKVS